MDVTVLSCGSYGMVAACGVDSAIKLYKDDVNFAPCSGTKFVLDAADCCTELAPGTVEPLK